MAAAVALLFKVLTKNDFFRINSGNIGSGGGQAYLDFRTRDVPVQAWESFFAGSAQRTVRTNGPAWTFPVLNLGTGTLQPTPVTAYQRRGPTVSITSQKLPDNSEDANRILAWRPDLTDFPEMPKSVSVAADVPDQLIDGLRVFLIRDDQNRVWAGWIKGQPDNIDDPRLLKMFSGDVAAAIIQLGGDYDIEPTDLHWPLRELGGNPRPWDDDDELETPESSISYSLQKLRRRDQAAARSVRKLYAVCQLTGPEFIFNTRKGKPYLEVHHLIPLGKGGADSPHNMIVVSAQAHKMLHYAEVSAIDLSQVQNNQLPITINGKAYTIIWHPQHAARVLAHNQP
ncbi:MAG: 5-methylcytosine-specific restriction enzyme [Sphingomonadales bacterium]|jgi:5-methylcytosine-specific restriction protein A|nr:5-methylcytosine-specific restriction enzyme [Sphingomonadales bacterium]